MPAGEATDIDRVLERVREVLPSPVDWAEPDGWPGEIEAAVLDSVFSIRARYGGRHTGVRAVVARWRASRAQPLDDLEALASVTNTSGLAELLDNRQTLHAGTTKAAGVVTVARNLLEVGVRHAADVGAPAARSAWCAVPGLTEVTWSYVLMLLGTPGVKADRMGPAVR